MPDDVGFPFFATLTSVDPADWRWQMTGLAVSLLGLTAYFFGYVLAYRKPPTGSRSLAGMLYVLGILASFAWYAMPFLPQPRFPGLLDLMARPGEMNVWIGAATQMFGLYAGIRYFSYTLSSTILNLSVTSRNFFAPERLLTTGVYGKVRHPMLMGDVVAHMGIALATGGALTVALFPIYYLINETFVEIQERFVLLPKFGDAYRDYSRQVPRMMSRPLGLTFAFGMFLAITTLAVAQP